MKILIKATDMFFYLGLFLITLSSTVIGKTYLFEIPYLNPIIKFAAIICFFLGFLCEHWNIKKLSYIIIIFLVLLLVSIISDSNMIAIYAFAILFGARENFSKICRFLFKVNIILIIFVIMLCFLGILNNEIYIRENVEKSYSMGFAYYSTLAYYILFLSILGCFLYCKNHKRKHILLYVFISLIINYIAYMITKVKLTIMCSMIFAILIILYDRFRFIKYKKINFIIAVVMYPFMFTLSIILPFIYQKNDFLIAFDNWLNGRLYFSKIGFIRYGVTLFGNHIITDAGGFDANWRNTYFFIDSGYMYLLLGYGIIVTILVIVAYTIISIYAVKIQNSKLFVWCILVCIFSFVNNPLLDIILNPLLFLIMPILNKKIKRIKNISPIDGIINI